MLISLSTALLPIPRKQAYIDGFLSLHRLNIEKRKSTVRECRVLWCLFLITTIYFVFLLFVPIRTRYQQVITFNIIDYNRFPKILHLEVLLAWIFVLIIGYSFLYEAITNTSVQKVRDVVQKKDHSFIYSSNTGVDITIVRYFKLYQMFTIAGTLFLITNYIIFMRHLLYDFGRIDGAGKVLGIVCFHVCFFLLSNLVIFFLYFGIFSATTAIGGVLLFFIRMKALDRLLRAPPKMIFLLLYTSQYIKTLKFVFEINKLFGKLLVALLCLTSPISATALTVVSIRKGLPLPFTIAILGMSVGVLTALVLVHYLATRYDEQCLLSN